MVTMGAQRLGQALVKQMMNPRVAPFMPRSTGLPHGRPTRPTPSGRCARDTRRPGRRTSPEPPGSRDRRGRRRSASCPGRDRASGPTGTARQRTRPPPARRRPGRPAAVSCAALDDAGLVVDGSAAGLYLWARMPGPGQDSWQTVADLADLGILVAPGTFYGPAGGRHVRIALTASDESVARAAARLTGA